jgi:tyrosinase
MPAITLNRRDVLLGSAATALLLAQSGKAWSAAAVVRPDIATSAGRTMVGLYALAVKAMQDPAINYPPQPQSWTFQAYMHAVPLNPFDPANSAGLPNGTPAFKDRVDIIYGNPAAGTPQAAWKEAALACWATCKHSSPYFTTWHRWYLHYFEAICRKACGNPDFALPYWNYASNNGSSLQLPDQFTRVSPDRTKPNVLFFDDRGLGFADGQADGPQNVAMNAGGFMPFSQTQYGPALATREMFPSDDATHQAFDTTSKVYLALGMTGRLECLPHDMVHVNVGGWMKNVPSAAGDPIFYMHHCQIDRLYASWEARPNSTYNYGTGPRQPSEDNWKNVTTGWFVNEDGKLVKEKLGGAVNTSALNYSYDKLVPPTLPVVTAAVAAGATPSAPVVVAAVEAQKFKGRGGGCTVTLVPAPAAPQAAPAPGAAPQAAPPAVGAPRAQTLVLKGIKLLRRPRAPLSVFINLPKGTPPRLNDPYYVGTLNFFNFDLATGGVMNHDDDDAHAAHAAAGAEARFDVSDVLLRQRAKGLWDGGAVTVTVSTIGADSPAPVTYVTIESIALVP